MKNDVFDETVLFSLGPIPCTATIATTVAVSAFILVCAKLFCWATSRPTSGRLASLSELTLSWLDELVANVVGRREPRLTAFSGTMFLFIAICNLVGLVPGMRAPTASIATTSALAVLVLLAVPFFGIQSRGIWDYLKEYFRPNPLFFPLHVISELSRTLALSMRLFGNMMSGHLTIAILVSLAGLIVPVPLMALHVLIGILQAYIFAVLTTVYIGAAVRAGEE